MTLKQSLNGIKAIRLDLDSDGVRPGKGGAKVELLNDGTYQKYCITDKTWLPIGKFSVAAIRARRAHGIPEPEPCETDKFDAERYQFNLAWVSRTIPK